VKQFVTWRNIAGSLRRKSNVRNSHRTCSNRDLVPEERNFARTGFAHDLRSRIMRRKK
jgi:hypothetical protein